METKHSVMIEVEDETGSRMVEVQVPKARSTLNRPALPPRLLQVPRDRWACINTAFGDEVTAQLRVRCGVKDCPGDLGRISLTRSPQPINGATEHLVFEPARGLFERESCLWAAGKRARAFLRRGQRPLGRRPHGQGADRDFRGELTRFEMPGNVTPLVAQSSVDIECPVCGRLVRMFGAEAHEALVGCRSTV